MTSRKVVRIGFDLDGVIIGKPFFVPVFLMEKLVRQKDDGRLAYRYPKTGLERWVRILSHNPLIRPPIKKNITLIKELYKSNNYKIFVVSSRYAFLKDRTHQWFKFYKMRHLFEKIYINNKDEQPQVFKERMIKKLKLDVFIDDDRPLLKYLLKRLKNVQLVCVDNKNKDFYTSV